MRKKYSDEVEQARVTKGDFASNLGDRWGAFLFTRKYGRRLKVLVGVGFGWEHVSASHNSRVPNWDEMCWVKHLFFEADEWVVQFHPAVDSYVNKHPHCLHLWRPVDGKFPVPPEECV